MSISSLRSCNYSASEFRSELNNLIFGGVVIDTEDSMTTRKQYSPQFKGWVPTEALDLTTPAGRATASLLSVFAEFEREMLRERSRAGLAHAREDWKPWVRRQPTSCRSWPPARYNVVQQRRSWPGARPYGRFLT